MRANTKAKDDELYKEAVDLAKKNYGLFPMDESLRFLCPYLFSSEMSDAYWITVYSLFHTGCIPTKMHKSRGHSWIISFKGKECRVEVVKQNMADGIKFL